MSKPEYKAEKPRVTCKLMHKVQIPQPLDSNPGGKGVRDDLVLILYKCPFIFDGSIPRCTYFKSFSTSGCPQKTLITIPVLSWTTKGPLSADSAVLGGAPKIN